MPGFYPPSNNPGFLLPKLQSQLYMLGKLENVNMSRKYFWVFNCSYEIMTCNELYSLALLTLANIRYSVDERIEYVARCTVISTY